MEINKKTTYFVTLPFPPSVNHYWGHRAVGKRVMMYINKRGKEYRQAVMEAVTNNRSHFNRFFKKPHRLAVSMIVCPPDKRRRDLDNLCKAPLDALEAAGVFEDDEQIDVLSVQRIYDHDAKDGALVIRISQLSEETDDVQIVQDDTKSSKKGSKKSKGTS